jgi:ABC-type transport system involved in multi-copper enzyme maturation permease subunit
MKSVLTILRRDLGAYFTSPIGYIFMMVFVSVSVGLMFTITFFVRPVAHMRPLFGSLPLLLCVFIPAVTMRLWAEERKENTWEMLLTFPMRAWELVVGKYLASLVFFCIALAATCTVPIMLASLGKPDGGAIFAGYLGAALLGAFFLAIGAFISGFFKDQILAFVVTLLACIATFLVGNQFVQTYMDSAIPGLGTLLAGLIGLSGHYDAFARGVVELADIFFFLAWIVVFLFLNIVFIDGRSRPRAKTYFAATVVVCMSCGMLGNWLIADASLARFDLTKNKIYTISDASKNILASLTAPVRIQYYVSPKNDMPTLMNTIEQEITDKLDELRVASNGKVEFKVIHLNASNFIDTQPSFQQQEEPQDEEAALETRMKDKGIAPFSVQAMSDDQFTSMFVYSTIGVAYKDKKEELIPQIIPQRLPDIEYTLMNTIYKVAREKSPIVALVAPVQTISPQMQMIYMQRGMQPPPPDDPYEGLQQLLTFEKYDVRRVEITQNSPLPDEYDTLVVVGPRALNDRQKWEINRAIIQGKSVVLAVQNYEWDY